MVFLSCPLCEHLTLVDVQELQLKVAKTLSCSLTCPICSLDLDGIHSLHNHLADHIPVNCSHQSSRGITSCPEHIPSIEKLDIQDELKLPADPPSSQSFIFTTTDKAIKEPVPIQHNCDLCGLVFSSEHFLSIHKDIILSKSNIFEVKCKLCKAKFKDIEMYRNHVRDLHGNHRYFCDSCPKSFKMKGGLLVHTRMFHDQSSPGTCQVCKKHFTSKARKELHEKRFHIMHGNAQLAHMDSNLDHIQRNDLGEAKICLENLIQETVLSSGQGSPQKTNDEVHSPQQIVTQREEECRLKHTLVRNDDEETRFANNIEITNGLVHGTSQGDLALINTQQISSALARNPLEYFASNSTSRIGDNSIVEMTDVTANLENFKEACLELSNDKPLIDEPPLPNQNPNALYQPNYWMTNSSDDNYDQTNKIRSPEHFVLTNIKENVQRASQPNGATACAGVINNLVENSKPSIASNLMDDQSNCSSLFDFSKSSDDSQTPISEVSSCSAIGGINEEVRTGDDNILSAKCLLSSDSNFENIDMDLETSFETQNQSSISTETSEQKNEILLKDMSNVESSSFENITIKILPELKLSFEEEFMNHSSCQRNQDETSRNSELKQWECDVCKKSFTTKYFLKKHKRLHTGETPYACGECGKTFTFQQSYHKHVFYHSDDKPHICSYCGRAFKEMSTLHNHVRIHTGEKPFECPTCGKAFRQRVSYLVHQRIHTGLMPYRCDKCGRSFRYKVSLRSHKCDAKPGEESPVNAGSPNSNEAETNNNNVSTFQVTDNENKCVRRDEASMSSEPLFNGNLLLESAAVLPFTQRDICSYDALIQASEASTYRHIHNTTTSSFPEQPIRHNDLSSNRDVNNKQNSFHATSEVNLVNPETTPPQNIETDFENDLFLKSLFD